MSQRRIAAEILKVGENRVWVDPEKTEDVEIAITREEIRRLIHEGAIRPLPKKGISRSRARVAHIKRKAGKRKGSGSRRGSNTSRIPRKEKWKRKIRAIRDNLKEFRDRRIISKHIYRQMYLMAKGGTFESVSHLKQHIETHKLKRKR